MTKNDISSRHFRRKISDFCDLRIGPIASRRVLENIQPYLVSLIIHRKSPPLLNGHIDWTTIGQACGIEAELTAELKKQLRPGLDAIIRWLGAAPAAEERRPPKPTAHQVKKASTTKAAFPPSTRKPQRATTDGAFGRSGSSPRGPAPKPISPFPEPLFEATEDPASFKEALTYHMRRFGDTYWQLYRAVVHLNETFDNKTLLSWIQGERFPRSVASFDILRRIERRYGLSEGYFKEKLPHQARSLYGHDLGDISPAERRRISLHLPDDFSSLPFTKREEILDWVRRVIVSGSTEYRRYQAAASIRYFDTAPYYGSGLCERRLGAGLVWRPRSEFLLSTKVGIKLDPFSREPAVARYYPHHAGFASICDYTAEGIAISFETSLHRLGIPSVDIAYMHGLSICEGGIDAALATGMPALIALRDAERTRMIGVGANTPEIAMVFLQRYDIDLLLFAGGFSLADHSEARAVLDLCEERGTGVIAASPFASGRYFSPANENFRQKLQARCLEFGIHETAAIMQFGLRHPAVLSVLWSTKTPANIDLTISASQAEINEDFWIALKRDGLLHL